MCPAMVFLKEMLALYTSKNEEADQSNFLGHIFSHYHRYIPQHKKFNTMPTLSAISRDAVEWCIPEDIIRVGLALWTLRYDINDWLNNSSVPVTVELPIPPHKFDIFSYPDLSTDRSQIESRVIDPSHCLMNLRVHATTKGFFGCDPNAFKHVSAADNTVLSKALLVEPLEDKQSVSFALKVFSSEVEQTMHNNRDMKEAELVKNVQNWVLCI